MEMSHLAGVAKALFHYFIRIDVRPEDAVTFIIQIHSDHILNINMKS